MTTLSLLIAYLVHWLPVYLGVVLSAVCFLSIPWAED